jgi:hypothetical protein
MGGLPDRAWSSAVTAIVVTALGVVGCGGSDDGADTAQANARAAAGALTKMQDAFYAGDAAAVCQSLTAEARAEVALGSDGRRTSCEQRIGALVRILDEGGGTRGPKPEIVREQVDGGSVTFVMREGHRPSYRIPMAREGGAWKVDLALTAGLQGR